jgi:hypothetical protein
MLEAPLEPLPALPEIGCPAAVKVVASPEGVESVAAVVVG